jgi:hypothetical protein
LLPSRQIHGTGYPYVLCIGDLIAGFYCLLSLMHFLLVIGFGSPKESFRFLGIHLNGKFGSCIQTLQIIFRFWPEGSDHLQIA